MNTDQRRPDMRHLWQGQTVEGASMSADDVRAALAKLNRIEHRRTWVSALFCLIFAGALGVLLTKAAATPIVHRGEWLFTFGGGFFLFQALLGWRRAHGNPLTRAEPEGCAIFYKSILEKQRRFYRRSTLWVPLLISACLLPVILLATPLRVIMIALWVMLVPFWIHESMAIVRRSQHELDRLNS